MTPVMVVVPVLAVATVMVWLPIATAAKVKFPPVTVVTIGLVVVKVIAGVMLIAFVALSVSALAPPDRLNAFPPIVKAPEPALMVMDAKDVPPAKSLLGDNRVLPPKTRISPATGAVPPQFAAVVQLLSPPPPFQVRVAA